MFNKQNKRFFIVVNKHGGITDGTHHASIESAREKAEGLALNNPGVEFLVCAADSSYVAVDICATHYS
jgi:hypothetical protein